ncbi:MAG: DUF3298 and DUF4163 domain-containing protein [Acidobacteriota bacterium]
MVKRFLSGFITMILAVSIVACSNKKDTNDAPSVATQASPQAPDLTPPAAPTPTGKLVEAPAKFNKTLVGTLNGNIEIQMNLTRDGKNLSGSYFYENVREPIELSGTVEKDGSCKITELIGDQETGVFKGRINGEELGGVTSLRFEGTWAKPNGEKAMSFALQEQRFVLNGGLLNIVNKKLQEENKKQHYEYEASYPQLDGVKDAKTDGFNKAIAGMINSQVSRFKKDAPESFNADDPEQVSGLWIDYHVTFASDELISVVFDMSEYSAGAAHPNSYSTTFNYDLRNGKEIKLRELFANANFLQVIANHCTRTLTARLKKIEAYDETMVKDGASAKADNYSSWNITRKGLLFNFDPYQVAAYAVGPQEVLIGYESLKEVLKKDSPIASLIGGNASGGDILK